MLLAMSMVAMVVVLMSLAVYAVVSRALYDDIDNQLYSRARLLIESGSLAADPGKAIEGTAYSEVNAMLVNPGRSIFTGCAGSGTFDTWSRMSKMRFAPAAAFCVTETMRLIESSRP